MKYEGKYWGINLYSEESMPKNMMYMINLDKFREAIEKHEKERMKEYWEKHGG